MNGSRLRSLKTAERVAAGSRRTFGGCCVGVVGTTTGVSSPWKVEPTITVSSAPFVGVWSCAGSGSTSALPISLATCCAASFPVPGCAGSK